MKNGNYISLPGWEQSTFGIEDYANLPENAVNYIEFIEKEETFTIHGNGAFKATKVGFTN